MGASLGKYKNKRATHAEQAAATSADGIALGVPVEKHNKNVKVRESVADWLSNTHEQIPQPHPQPNPETKAKTTSRGERAQEIALAKLKENNKQALDQILKEIDERASKGLRRHTFMIKNFEPAIDITNIKESLQSDKFSVLVYPKNNKGFYDFDISF